MARKGIGPRNILDEVPIDVTTSAVARITSYKRTGTATDLVLDKRLTRITLHNIDTTNYVEVLWATSQPTSGRMDILKPNDSKTYEVEYGAALNLWLKANSATVKVNVLQEG